MSGPQSVAELDLSPIPGKQYWDNDREWREEFIYFLLVDRFHDNRERRPVSGKARTVRQPDGQRWGQICGGTLKGITRHLDYILNLGCTALWLSPVFENNQTPWNYHGYAIQNYLNIDPRFGTKQDLIDLVQAAHDKNMRVFLDVVTNHSGDNWTYPGGYPYYYYDDVQFDFGAWRFPDRPIPIELRNPAFYHRRGEIRNWDAYPEAERGDFFSLKDYNNDEDTPEATQLQRVLIQAHRYWIREADVDGFRLDAVKHMRPKFVSRFCSQMREYAYRLGKRNFFLFGELIADDSAIDRYIGPNTATLVGDNLVYYGLSSALDFPLYWVLPGVLKGMLSPQLLFDRYEKLRYHALSRGELGRYLVTFLDSHDQVGQDYKRRFGADAPDRQVIAGIGYLLCSLGATCIYYGTEQGFSGQGNGDQFIREPMFDLDDPAVNYLNQDCTIYQEIAKIARIHQELEALRFGRMYFRAISGNGVDFGLPYGHPCTLAFSRILSDQEVLVAYNTSATDTREDSVIIDGGLAGAEKRFVYGAQGTVPVQSLPDGTHFVRLRLEPMQFVILR
jgi:glycosidase